MTSVLNDEELQEKLAQLDQWEKVPGEETIHRSFQFKHFRAAFAFMTQCALVAEKMDHHPDWSNSYNTVHVHLSTHDQGGVTQKDLDLANKMNQAAASFS